MIIKEEYQENALLLFKGTLPVNLISILGNHLRMMFTQDFKGLQKIFKVFIELAQNVSYYSAETMETENGIFCGAGWISVQEFKEEYHISTGNRIKPEHGPTLHRYCDEINSLTEEELRKLKRELRAQSLVKDTGAHVGLIQSCILSGNKLDYFVSDGDAPEHIFVIRVKIRKEQP